MEDRVAVALRQWADVAPGVDVSPLGVTGRLLALAPLLAERREAILAADGLGVGDFDVLATLRRSAGPEGLKPRELLDTVMVTSGGMSKRLDRLERDGFIRRVPDPDDRRGVLVRLTPAGRRAVDRLLPRLMAAEGRLLDAALGASARKAVQAGLAALLRQAEAGRRPPA